MALCETGVAVIATHLIIDTSNGVDDTATLQGALATYETVHIKATLLIGSTVNLTRSVMLIADPGYGVRLVGQVPIVFLVKDCAGSGISGMQVDVGGFAARAIHIQDTQDCTFSYNKFSNGNGGTAYIFAIRNNRNTYKGNIINGSKGKQRGLWIGNTGKAPPGIADVERGAVIENNVISGTDATGIVYMGDNGVIRGNHVYDTQGAGLAISSTSTYAVTQNTYVERNVFVRNAFHGFQSDAWQGALTDNITAVRNVCISNGHSGIYAAHVKNWTLIENEGGMHKDGDIVLYDAHTVNLNNNKMTITDQGHYPGGVNSDIRIG